MSQQSSRVAPRVFMSYSHDDKEHRDWVLALATRLRADGVDVCLDRWDVTLGGNLAHFMEKAANASYRVVAVISASYARKADERKGGTGVEAQMLSTRLYESMHSDQVIPIIRNNPTAPPLLPAFLGGRLWLDFRDDQAMEAAYERLIRDIHNAPVDIVPTLGPNPFEGKSDIEARLEIRNSPLRWHSPGLTGDVEFIYSQNSGMYTIGTGSCQFTLELSPRGTSSVYAYRDPLDIKHVAMIEKVESRRPLLTDVSQFDTSSRAVGAGIDDAIVLHNKNDYWAIVIITAIFERQKLNPEKVIQFRYTIQSNRTANLHDAVPDNQSQDGGKL